MLPRLNHVPDVGDSDRTACACRKPQKVKRLISLFDETHNIIIISGLLDMKQIAINISYSSNVALL